MKNLEHYKWFFFVAALYDLLLGLGFFLMYEPIYTRLGIEMPSNPAYLHLAAAMVFVQGLGYYFVMLRPVQNVDIVRVGVIYKAAYAGVAFYYWVGHQLPHVMFGWFGVLDVLFLLYFLKFLSDAAKPSSAGG